MPPATRWRMWVEYWELSNRLGEAQQAELDAFYARWPGTYVEDRLRNDWLLELGRRRDWANFRVEFPRFRMNDDREVTCYALLTQHLDGQDVRDAARGAWFAQRDPDDGCNLLATTLYEAKVLKPADAWHKARLAIEMNRPRAARAAAALVRPATTPRRGRARRQPGALAAAPAAHSAPAGHELELLALMRLAASDPGAAAGAAVRTPGPSACRHSLAATAWAARGQAGGDEAAARRLPPTRAAPGSCGTPRREAARRRPGATTCWPGRCAPRCADAGEASRWPLMTRAIDAMSAAEQRDSAWVYWRARAAAGQRRAGPARRRRRAPWRRGAASRSPPQLGFYGKLATEDLGGTRRRCPPRRAPLTRRRARGRAQPRRAWRARCSSSTWACATKACASGTSRCAAWPTANCWPPPQLACEREVWDRCINTSDRTRGEVDMAQRFPDALPRAGAGAGARDRHRPGRGVRPDPPGVALHHGRALHVGASGPDAADAGHRALDGAQDRPATTRPR